MKKQARILSLLIFVVLLAMCLPWAHLSSSQAGPDSPTIYSATWLYYIFGFAVGSFYTTESFLCALLAFGFSLCSGKRHSYRLVCGLLLFISSAFCFYSGIRIGFDRFTPLTWGIFASLILLGLWALYTFIRTPKEQKTEQTAPKA